ncbi:MAG: DegT/DnrJ/EryC1/StrS family aminotransferase [Thioalkalivibrio sp.]|nr:DegT/DnrJ/EryC1/StrS family aminotransferase [Thioalkalivibrio sp.]
MSDAILMTDVAWQHEEVRSEIEDAFRRLIEDPTCDAVPFAHALERAFEAFFGASWFAVSAQSGLAVQTLLLRAWGIGPGDEVIVPPNSDLATTAAISHVGARFVLADVAAGSFHLDPSAAERAITPATRALLPVHMYGQPTAMLELRALADDRGLLLLEDAALALGASDRGNWAGTLGDGGFFSFAPRKVLGGLGNGGLALVKDPKVARRMRLLRGYGLDPDIQELPIAERHLRSGQVHFEEGYNLKIDGLNAAVVHAKFGHLESWGAMRRSVADRYDAGLAGIPGITRPARPPGTISAWRNYTILADRRDALRDHLRERAITAAVLYAPPVHLQPVYAHLDLGPGSFPVAEAQAPQLLCLPIFPGMRDDQVDRVVDEVRSFHERR